MTLQQTNDIKEIFSQYSNIIVPLVLNYEVIASEFPIEILNEIRSIMTHLSKCCLNDTDSDIINENIRKANGHLKRAILDCFKYTCMEYQAVADSFSQTHANILTYIDNGRFIDSFVELGNNARILLKHAKQIENEALNVEESYEAYEAAYNAYDDLYKLVTTTQMESEKMKKHSDSELARKYLISKIGNVIMGAITVTSIIVTIISWFR